MPMMLAFQPVFDVLHPDHPDGLDWRRCKLTTILHDETLLLHVKLRGKTSGPSVHDVFDSMGFTACLERVFVDLISPADPGLEIAETRPLLRATSRSFAQARSGSGATLTFTLGSHIGSPLAETISRMSSHTRLALHTRASEIAQREAARRSGRTGAARKGSGTGDIARKAASGGR